LEFFFYVAGTIKTTIMDLEEELDNGEKDFYPMSGKATAGALVMLILDENASVMTDNCPVVIC
jgi:hypothetical protein